VKAKTSTAERAVSVALGATCALAGAKIAVGWATGSLAVLSQALDSVVDVVALILLFIAVRVAAKPADDEHHYGHGKAENLAAFVQTLVIAAVVVRVAVEAVQRLTSPATTPSTPWFAFALLATSAAVDLVRVRILASAARAESSDALAAGALNFITDVGTALVALVSLGFVRAGFARADAVGALLVAAAVVVGVARVGKRSVDVLMDRAPAPVAAIAAAAAATPGVAETRRVRVRGSGSRLFTDVTVSAGRTSSLERAHDIAERVEQRIERVAPGADVVVHVEPVSETSGLVEQVQAAASRVDGVHEVHNVLVRRVRTDGTDELHVTLHAKASADISLGQAHALSDEIERAVSDELEGDVRVDTHIEPLEPTTVGLDVTSERPDIAAAVRRVALEEPDVLDCHEVLVSSSDGTLAVVAHVAGRNDLPLERIHDASQRIEKTLHGLFPEIGSVLIHFEPA
jgi:cation diffusion facilitator family transporter